MTFSSAAAQGDLEGRVISTEGTPIRAAEILILQLNRAITTDSLGRFVVRDLPSRDHRIVIRAVGFRPDTVTVAIQEQQVVVRDFALSRTVAALGEVRVTGEASSPKLAGFDARRRQGIGHFIDRPMLEKMQGRSTAAVLSTLPGMAVWHGTGLMAWAYSTRGSFANSCAFCKLTIDSLLNGYDVQRGARPACYMDVYVDGALVYQYGTRPPQDLFNINSIPPDQILGIESYVSTAQIPAQFNRTSTAGCGVLIIWTRI
jgi:carboxypeptidase family protein